MIQGLHHITTIAGSAQHNLDFYTRVLGLHLVKRTVHFNNPSVYHLYYGDQTGSPGSLLSFFHLPGVLSGRRGARQVNEVGLSVPQGSLDKWLDHLKIHQVRHHPVEEKFGEPFITLYDPDGLKLELTAARNPAAPDQKFRPEINGLHQVTISANNLQATADTLTNILGYQLLGQEVNRYRFITPGSPDANIVDLVDTHGEAAGQKGLGIVHHAVFRVRDNEALSAYRLTIAALGWEVSAKFDHPYFNSFYFRQPGGLLFGIATDQPGLTVDEPLERLGKKLLLPPQFEDRRFAIQQHLPQLNVY